MTAGWRGTGARESTVAVGQPVRFGSARAATSPAGADSATGVRDSKYNICQLERAQGRLSTWSTSGNQSLQSRPAAGKKGVFNSSSPAIDTFALQHVL